MFGLIKDNYGENYVLHVYVSDGDNADHNH